jgi:hypothetical protein
MSLVAFGVLAHPACICEWACVCGGQRKENLICSSCPRTFHSALFLSWVKSRKRCYFLPLSHSDSLGKDGVAGERRGWVTGQRSAHGRRGSNFPLRAQPPKLTIYTLHTRLISFWAYAPRSLSLYTHQKKTQRSRKKLDNDHVQA